MAAYLITGPNGSGKSTIGRLLASKGYKVIEMDQEPGLSSWVDANGQKVTEFPSHPFSQEWLDAHKWNWSGEKLQEIINTHPHEPIFFCGGAYNQKDFYDLFAERFTLYLDDATTIKRLQGREPERWKTGSAELARTLAWNSKSKQISIDQGSIVIDGGQPTEQAVSEILSHIHEAI